jgi:hypothetical protein
MAHARMRAHLHLRVALLNVRSCLLTACVCVCRTVCIVALRWLSRVLGSMA